MFSPRAWMLPALAMAVLAVPLQPARAAGDATKTLAHIKLSGNPEESAPAEDPIFGGVMGETFKLKLDRIKKAKNDKTVHGLYLELEGLDIGWAKLDELTEAIADFRKSGKKVFAFLQSGEPKDYLLALACDEVCAPESGLLMLNGLRAEVTFYKDLLDHVGIEADFLRMGEAKSAVEPFTSTKMSDASRKQLEGVLDDRYEHGVVERIVKSRADKKFTADQVKKLIDQGPYTPKAALKAGLIDRVAYEDKYSDEIKSVLKADKVTVVKNYGQAKAEEIDFTKLMMKMLAPPKMSFSNKPKIAVIYATGVIISGKSSQSILGSATCGSHTMIEAIRQAEEDANVKAIVLRVDSPGGSAFASDLIWNELKKCKKPVVASMGDVAASGGYYICMSGSKIFADPGTLTGSIGVFGGKMTFAKLYDKIGLKTEVISRGANANILSMDSKFSASERAAMSAFMKDVYDQFLDKALEGRKKAGKDMTRDQLEKLAGGRIWTGRQAKANGLIDELGTLEDALAEAKKQAGVPEGKEMDILALPKARSLVETLLDLKGDSKLGSPELRSLQLLREVPELNRKLSGVEGLLQLRGEPAWLLAPYKIDVR
jgi:protease-4